MVMKVATGEALLIHEYHASDISANEINNSENISV